MEPFFSLEFFGNSAKQWIFFLGFSLFIFLVLEILKSILVAKLRSVASKTESILDDIALSLLEHTHSLFFLLLSLHAALGFISLPERAQRAFSMSFFFILFLQLGLWATQALHFLGTSYVGKTLNTDPSRATTIKAMMMLGKFLLWVTVSLLLLDNWGVKVAPFVAGLGIGGVAVALAVQNILGDLFASLSIILDKPFVIGDFISTGSHAGTVEHIGIKTTRLRSLTGEQLIFSNSDLLQSRVHNYKRMQERRIEISFGVVYHTPTEKLHRVREIVKEVIEKIGGARLDRCHLATLGASSLDFQLVYWVHSPEFNFYIEKHHALCVGLVEAFRREQIEFAYPTMVHLQGGA